MAQSKTNLKETPHSLNSGGNADETSRVPCPPSQGTRETVIERMLPCPKREFPANPTLEQMAVIVIDHMLCCDFMEDLEMAKRRGKIKEAYRLLSDAYNFAHACDPTHPCFKVHVDWRANLKARYAQVIEE